MNDDSQFTLIRLHQQARELVAVASTLELAPPAGYERLRAVEQAATDLARGADAVITVPTTATRVAAYVSKAATDRVTQREARTIAAEIAGRAGRDALRIMLDEAPKVLEKLRERFNKAAADFRTLMTTAPHEITAHTDADGFSRHTQLLRAVEILTMDAANRVQLGIIVGEEYSSSELLWMVLDLDGSASVTRTRAVLTEFAQRLPSTVTEWQTVAQLGMSLAGPFEAAKRGQAFHAAVFASGFSTPDGGMVDRTYAEAVALAEQDNPRPTIERRGQ